jgi:hypothetical protein
MATVYHMMRRSRSRSHAHYSQYRFETSGSDSLHRFGYAQQDLKLRLMVSKPNVASSACSRLELPELPELPADARSRVLR